VHNKQKIIAENQKNLLKLSELEFLQQKQFEKYQFFNYVIFFNLIFVAKEKSLE
jgi:hypothetical protein